MYALSGKKEDINMNIAVLIFLIFNFVLLLSIVGFVLYIIRDEKQKVWKRCHKAEDEADCFRHDLMMTKIELKAYKTKFPVKTKYKIDDIVFAKHNDFTYNGRIVAVIIKKDETSTNNIIDYMIDYQGRTVTVNEVNVYLEKH